MPLAPALSVTARRPTWPVAIACARKVPTADKRQPGSTSGKLVAEKRSEADDRERQASR